MATFEAVTGEKTDDWLVKTVGALVLVVGAVLITSIPRAHPVFEVVVLGAGASVHFACIDVVYATRGRIAKVYLLDAALEAALFAGWMIAAARLRTQPKRRRRWN